MGRLTGFCDNLEFRMSMGHNAYRDNMYTETGTRDWAVTDCPFEKGRNKDIVVPETCMNLVMFLGHFDE